MRSDFLDKTNSNIVLYAINTNHTEYCVSVAAIYVYPHAPVAPVVQLATSRSSDVGT